MKIRKNKKAMLILLMSSIAFLIAAILFFKVGNKINVGPKVDFIGHTQYKIFDYYGSGEEMLLYLDIAAKESAGIVWQKGMSETQFIILFKPVFNKYLENFNKKFPRKEFNLSVDNYTISVKDKKLILTTDKRLQVARTNLVHSDDANLESGIKYKINPSISIILKENIEPTKVEAPKLETVTLPSPSTVSLRV